MAYQRIHFIINPASGQPEPILSTINDALKETDVDWSVSVTTTQRDGASLAREAVKSDAELIVAYGGDGTLNSIINGMANSETPLALLHGGTGNALAYELNIPIDLGQAVRDMLNYSHTRPLDLGEVICLDESEKRRYFILRSNIGLHNRMLEQATPELKQQFGNFGYIIAGLRSLSESEPLTFHIEMDGETRDVDGISCMVANSAAMGGAVKAVFAPDIDPGDGQLDIFVINSDFESLVSMVNSSLNADLSEYPNHWRGRKMRIEMDQRTAVTLDGEPFCETPIEIRVVPQALHILVPHNQEEAQQS